MRLLSIRENVMSEKRKNIIKKLSKSEKMKLAKYSRDPEILKELADDLDADVRRTVAGNLFCTGETLLKLKDDIATSVISSAVSTITLKKVNTEYQLKEVQEKVLDAIHEDPTIRQLLKDDEINKLYEAVKKNETVPDVIKANREVEKVLPQLSVYEKLFKDGVLLGSMLSGAYDYGIDLYVAQRTGKRVDKADPYKDMNPEKKLKEKEIER